ncbi:MAG: GNAT family N-acetyltransferase [Limnochordia bacterium]|jgi:GNAT superfamily N-acetyltransferase
MDWSSSPGLSSESVKVRPYTPADEEGWVGCPALAFLKTPCFDYVLREKEHGASPAIELVAVSDGQLVGLLDIESETEPGSVCSPHPTCSGPAGAVHPDRRGRGIGGFLLQRGVLEACRRGSNRLEAWIRDDPYV